MPSFPAARVVLGAALSCALAVPASALLSSRRDAVQVLVICALAAVLAVAAPRLRVHPKGPAVVDVALGVLIALASVHFPGPWPLVFAVASAVLLVCGLVLARFERRGALALGAVLLVGSAVGWQQAGQRDLHSPVHAWNQYHYVLGTKYFPEVGSHDLYLATLLADAEGPGRLAQARKVRNMHTYQPLTIPEAHALARERGVRERFSDARWAEFRHDWAVFAELKSGSSWASVITDLGYNASPVWVALYRPLLEVIELDHRTLEALALLQVPMFVGTVAVAWWAFGRRATLWIVLWTLLFFGNRGRLYGGFFSYDWYALAVVGAALVARGRAVLAAPLVALAGLMRGFGGLLAIGPTVHELAHLWRHRRLSPWDTRFLAVLALSMALLGAGSLAAGRGVDGWVDWADKISLHSKRISTGGRHLGMKVLFGEDWSQPGHTADLAERRRVYREQAWAYHLAQVVLVGWTALVMRRRGRLDAALLGLIPAFALMVLSRYYYSAWAVLLLLGTTDEDRDGRPVVQLAMLSIIALHDGLRFVDGTTPDSRHQAVNLLMLGWAVFALGAWTVADLRAARRLSAEPPAGASVR